MDSYIFVDKSIPMHRYCLIVPLLLLSAVGFTQINKKDILIHTGLFSGNGFRHGLQETPTSSIHTAYLGAGYVFHKLFSAGLYGTYTNRYYKYDHSRLTYRNTWEGYEMGVRGTFHLSPLFIKNRQADLYVAGFCGYNSFALIYDKDNPYRGELNYNDTDINAGGILGFRYFLNEVIALYAEAGLSWEPFLGGGVSFNLHAKKSQH